MFCDQLDWVKRLTAGDVKRWRSVALGRVNLTAELLIRSRRSQKSKRGALREASIDVCFIDVRPSDDRLSLQMTGHFGDKLSDTRKRICNSDVRAVLFGRLCCRHMRIFNGLVFIAGRRRKFASVSWLRIYRQRPDRVSLLARFLGSLKIKSAVWPHPEKVFCINIQSWGTALSPHGRIDLT